MPELRNVLDVGYGAASWAIEMAESYPDCEVRSPIASRRIPLTLDKVIGVDISPHMKPDDTPGNFWPEVRSQYSRPYGVYIDESHS